MWYSVQCIIILPASSRVMPTSGIISHFMKDPVLRNTADAKNRNNYSIVTGEIKKTRNTLCRTRSLSNATLSFLITWSLSNSKSAAVYKISSKSDDFYRATRMHNADYAVARCLSVCLSHAGIESKRLYISSKFFSPSGSPTILVFPYQTGWQYSDGNPLTGTSNTREYEKITISDQYRALSRNWCKIEP